MNLIAIIGSQFSYINYRIEKKIQVTNVLKSFTRIDFLVLNVLHWGFVLRCIRHAFANPYHNGLQRYKVHDAFSCKSARENVTDFSLLHEISGKDWKLFDGKLL